MYFEGYFFIIPEKSVFFSVFFSLPIVVFHYFCIRKFESIINHLILITYEKEYHFQQ